MGSSPHLFVKGTLQALILFPFILNLSCKDEECLPKGAYDRVITALSPEGFISTVFSFSSCPEDAIEPRKGTALAGETESGWHITIYYDFEDPEGIAFKDETPLAAYKEGGGDGEELYVVSLNGEGGETSTSLVESCLSIGGVDFITSPSTLYPSLSFFCHTYQGEPLLQLTSLFEEDFSTEILPSTPCSSSGVSSIAFSPAGDPSIALACPSEEVGNPDLYFIEKGADGWGEYTLVDTDLFIPSGEGLFAFIEGDGTPSIFYIDRDLFLKMARRAEEGWNTEILAGLTDPISFSVSLEEDGDYHITCWEDYLESSGILYALLYTGEEAPTFSMAFEVLGIGGEVSITSTLPDTPHIFCNWRDGGDVGHLNYLTLYKGEWENTVIY